MENALREGAFFVLYVNVIVSGDLSPRGNLLFEYKRRLLRAYALAMTSNYFLFRNRIPYKLGQIRFQLLQRWHVDVHHMSRFVITHTDIIS
jgi:hypothetical protein